MEFECEFCFSVFSGKTELDIHVMDIHETVENIEKFLEKESKQTADENNINVNKEKENTKEYYKCNVCNTMSFNVFHEYQNHLKSHFTNFHSKQQQEENSSSNTKVFKKDGKTRLNFHPSSITKENRQIQKTFPQTTATAKNENCRKLKEGAKNDSIQWAKNLFKKVQFWDKKSTVLFFIRENMYLRFFSNSFGTLLVKKNHKKFFS